MGKLGEYSLAVSSCLGICVLTWFIALRSVARGRRRRAAKLMFLALVFGGVLWLPACLFFLWLSQLGREVQTDDVIFYYVFPWSSLSSFAGYLMVLRGRGDHHAHVPE